MNAMRIPVQSGEIETLAHESGFIRARARNLLPEDAAVLGQNARAVLLCAFCYGDSPPGESASAGGVDGEIIAGEIAAGEIAAFARCNYYREAVIRLKRLAGVLRKSAAGLWPKSGFRIFCNSRFNEKQLACRYGLGTLGRNSLVLTREAGSRFIIAGLTLPFSVDRNALPPPPDFSLCGGCPPGNAPCARACPTGALSGDGTLTRECCIQWYASGNGDGIPAGVRAHWGRRLYGCVCCQDACPYNQRPLSVAHVERGKIERFVNLKELLAQSDAEIKARFKGTAMGLSWISPAALRRSARCIIGNQ
ncbi:MAG: hypothetical protein LBC72_02265 [Spirochaetaceae bacterium]|nr:hypothetical protein [Spirochaetaceae bacterium]